MKIYAPVDNVNGIYASVLFVNSVGETDNPALIEWFKSHGYRLEKCDTPNFETMNSDELREWMREHGYGAKIKNTRNKDKLLEIVKG